MPTPANQPKAKGSAPPASSNANGGQGSRALWPPDAVFARLQQMDGAPGYTSGQVRTMSNVLFAVELRALRIALLGSNVGSNVGTGSANGQRASPALPPGMVMPGGASAAAKAKAKK